MKQSFKCIEVTEESRAKGLVSLGDVYPVVEVISENYKIIISEDGRGFPVVPDGIRFANAGEQFAYFDLIEEQEEPPIETPIDYIDPALAEESDE